MDLSRFKQDTTSSAVPYWKIIHPRFIPILIIRIAQVCYANIIFRPIAIILTWLNVILYGIEVTPKCHIGGGLFLPHTSGTVIGAASIGENATIFQGVTIGAKYTDSQCTLASRPTLGDVVMIGAGAKVLGGISIGSGGRVAANSLALESVPAGVTVIGVPASIMKRQEKY